MFVRDLRRCRTSRRLSLDELAARTGFPRDVLAAVETGPGLPSLPALEAYVRGCGEPLAPWEDRWRRLAPGAPAAAGGLPTRAPGKSPLAAAGAAVAAGTAPPAAAGTAPPAAPPAAAAGRPPRPAGRANAVTRVVAGGRARWRLALFRRYGVAALGTGLGLLAAGLALVATGGVALLSWSRRRLAAAAAQDSPRGNSPGGHAAARHRSGHVVSGRGAAVSRTSPRLAAPRTTTPVPGQAHDGSRQAEGEPGMTTSPYHQ